MNCTVYLFGKIGEEYIQYPFGDNIFLNEKECVDPSSRFVIQQKNNLICYKYIYHGTSFHVGLCVVYNGVVAFDVHNLFTTLEYLFDEKVLKDTALFDSHVLPKVDVFQKASESLQGVVDFFERTLSNSDFSYSALQDIGTSIKQQDSINLSSDKLRNEELTNALQKYEKVIVSKENKTQPINTLSAIDRIQNESNEWTQKAKDYDSSFEKKILIVLILLIIVTAFCSPYFKLKSPKAQVKEQIDNIWVQIHAINRTREQLSRKLSSIKDSINIIDDEVSAISQQLDLLESIQERNKPRRTFSVGGAEFTMIRVTGGKFMMGSNNGQDDESPTHYVTLRNFYIAETEVTQELWREVMRSNPSSSTRDSYPVTNVSWSDCLNFVKSLNDKTGLSFALPTEAQWEFAARGGNKSRGYKYSGSDSYSAVANCVEYSFWGDLFGYSNTLDYVKSYSSNELGIYDMSGNVWEWCYDSYAYYSYSEQKNPVNDNGENRIIRGGGYKNTSSYCRSTYRGYKKYSESADNIGFRLVLNE